VTTQNGFSTNGNDSGEAIGNGNRSLAVDWEPLARATAHPLRVSILEILGIDGGRILSPSDLSKELQIPLSNTNYHVTELSNAGLIELVRERQVRGATEHFYRIPVGPPPALKENGEAANGSDEKRTTGFEPATSSLGSLRSTN
jgi:DNA-binding transcriptional ArsR family regulator